MSRMFAIARLSLLELFRDKGELVGVIVLPLLLTWVFGTAFGSSGVQRALEVPVADLDGSRYTKAIVAEVDRSESCDVTEVSEAEARQLVAEGDSPVAIILPKGFGARLEAGEKVTLEALQYPGSQNGAAVVEIVQGAAGRVAANAEAALATQDLLASPPRAPTAQTAAEPKFAALYDIADEFWEPAPPVGVKATTVAATSSRAAELEAPANTQYSVGFTIFFVFMTALGSAGGVLEDREFGTLRRVLAAPSRRAEILAGKVLGVAAVSLFEAAMLVGFGAVIFGVPWGGNPLAVAVMLVALVLSATGLGVMVSAFVRTRSQMSALGPVLSTGLAMLGGCYWPIEIASPFMRTVAKFTPTGWAMAGLKDVVARGMGLDAVVLPVAILLAFSVVAIGIGVTRLRLE